jgi:hypothetical protein
MSNKVGKPLAFPTVESLQEAVDAYFAKDGESWDMTGEYPRFLPTMSGLALALNVDRKTVLNYSNKDEYFPTIRKARAIIENNLEKTTLDGMISKSLTIHLTGKHLITGLLIQ